MLGKGIGREGGGPGPAWAGEGRPGEERRAQPRTGRCRVAKLGCGALKDAAPAKRKSAGACHCLWRSCDGAGLAVLRVLLSNLSSVTLGMFPPPFFFKHMWMMVGHISWCAYGGRRTTLWSRLSPLLHGLQMQNVEHQISTEKCPYPPSHLTGALSTFLNHFLDGLVKVSIAVLRHYDRKQLREERVHLAHMSPVACAIENQGRSSMKEL